MQQRLQALESGQLFADAGLANMLVGDYFSWYSDDPEWPAFATWIDRLIARLGAISFDVARKGPNSTRDLFKGMYQGFVPTALRHALGEYYTPDWLAAHALDLLEWTPQDSLLDPTCGSGTFLLEALRRRLAANSLQDRDPSDLLGGLYGIDLNPLAVLAARASLVVYLSPYLRRARGAPVRLPIYLADAVNTADTFGQNYVHSLQTEQGVISFTIPKVLVEHGSFYQVMLRLRELLEAGLEPTVLLAALLDEFNLQGLSGDERRALANTVATLVRLRDANWNGIWTAILADRFSAAAIPAVAFIAGNPPWYPLNNPGRV